MRRDDDVARQLRVRRPYILNVSGRKDDFLVTITLSLTQPCIMKCCGVADS